MLDSCVIESQKMWRIQMTKKNSLSVITDDTLHSAQHSPGDGEQITSFVEMKWIVKT